MPALRPAIRRHRSAASRVHLAALLTGALLTAALATSPALAQALKVSEADLMANPALPDIVQGKADAPVTMIEYASMTCTHCAHFHATVYPVLKKDYIDTGKVKFILREFPLDPLATAGFMLARCEGADKRTAVVDLLFDTQTSWAFVDKPLESLEGILKQTGMGTDKFEACLKDDKLRDKVEQERDQGDKFGVHATPTFYVNGTQVTGEVSPQSLGKILDPLVSAKKS